MPKIVDHDQYREVLIQKCIELFSRRGYSNVTMREVAKELGVSTGSLYHYFPTKEAIFEKMFEHLRQSDVKSILDRIKDDFGPEDKLGLYGDHWGNNRDYYQSIVLIAIDYYRSNGREDISRVMSEYSNYYKEAIADNLEVPESLGLLIFIHMIGLMYHDLLIPDAELFKEQLMLFLDMTIAYIEKNYSHLASKNKTEAEV